MQITFFSGHQGEWIDKAFANRENADNRPTNRTRLLFRVDFTSERCSNFAKCTLHNLPGSLQPRKWLFFTAASVPTWPYRQAAFLILVVLSHGEIASVIALSRLLAQVRMSLPSAFALARILFDVNSVHYWRWRARDTNFIVVSKAFPPC